MSRAWGAKGWGGRRAGGPNFAVSSSPARNVAPFLPLWVFSLNCGGVFEAGSAQKHTFGFSGQFCASFRHTTPHNKCGLHDGFGFAGGSRDGIAGHGAAKMGSVWSGAAHRSCVWSQISQAARHSTPVSGGTGVHSAPFQRGR